MSQPINLSGRIRPSGDRQAHTTGHAKNQAGEFMFTEDEHMKPRSHPGAELARRPSDDFLIPSVL